MGILSLLAISIKIHSLLSFPKISDWNYHQLQKIDKTKKIFHLQSLVIIKTQ